jgi:hypothetical protein
VHIGAGLLAPVPDDGDVAGDVEPGRDHGAHEPEGVQVGGDHDGRRPLALPEERRRARLPAVLDVVRRGVVVLGPRIEARLDEGVVERGVPAMSLLASATALPARRSAWRYGPWVAAATATAPTMWSHATRVEKSGASTCRSVC